MSSSDAEQCERRPFGRTAVLFPIPEGMDADAHGVREASLGQADEASEGGDVITGFELAAHEASANTGWNGSSEVAAGQLWHVGHVSLLMWERKRACSFRVAQRAEMTRTTSPSRSVQTTMTRPRRIGPIAMKRSSTSEWCRRTL